jgi:hypothetical protein
MDLLDEILPNKQNWFIRNKTIYKSKIEDITIAKIIDGDVWIVFDKSIYKESLEVIDKCKEKHISFFLTTPRLIINEHIYQEDLEEIVYNYLSHLVDKKFYKHSTRIDLIKLLVLLIDEYDCLCLFEESHDLVKKQYNFYWWDRDKNLLDEFESKKRKLKIEIIKRKIKV